VNIYVLSIDIKESKSNIDFGLENGTDISCAALFVPISSIFKFVAYFTQMELISVVLHYLFPFPVSLNLLHILHKWN